MKKCYDNHIYSLLIEGGADTFSRCLESGIVNKCSFSGLTESSSFSKQASESNFSINGIDKLQEYSLMIKNWTITNLPYGQFLYATMVQTESDNDKIFTYLDPPYEIKSNLYGKKGNMHKGFAICLYVLFYVRVVVFVNLSNYFSCIYLNIYFNII